jgi:hypothetical protein
MFSAGMSSTPRLDFMRGCEDSKGAVRSRQWSKSKRLVLAINCRLRPEPNLPPTVPKRLGLAERWGVGEIFWGGERGACERPQTNSPPRQFDQFSLSKMREVDAHPGQQESIFALMA